MEKRVRTLEEFETEAAAFARTLLPREEGAVLVTLSGELGAGKTTFTKIIAKIFGVEEVVNSPTFVLEKMYTLPESAAFKKLVHIDAYRLENGNDLSALRFNELMQDSGNLILLEWPERVGDTLPEPMVRISITHEASGARKISYG